MKNSHEQSQCGAPVRGDIAIIGMSCLLPGASDLSTYWQNIVTKVDAVTDSPPEAWPADVFYAPTSTENDRVYCKRGGFISPLAYFDPLTYGIMPRMVEGGEPDQWLALDVARAAFRDAGYGDDIPEHDRTAVILGKGTYLNRGNLSGAQHGQVVEQTLEILRNLHPEYSESELQAIRRALKQQLPPFNADTAPGLIPNIIAGRIANRLNLMGPSYTIDAACASSLIAIDMAVHDLLTHRCDLALAGGTHVVTPVPVLMLFCQLNALSRQEQIRPFDKNADGTILGEGIGMVVLKRLADALRDGHRIYGVIKGVGVASDGYGMSVMAPRLEGEVLALQRAYEMAGVAPQTIGLLEAHGTGTPVGDMTEIKALSEVFGRRDGILPRTALGSVKSMIGHVMPAAGIAGLIKVALALYHKVLPPTLHVDEPNPEFQLEKTPFYINSETRPWIHGDIQIPRRAGVNAFGFGGINAHVVLEEAPVMAGATFQNCYRDWETEVCILAAASRSELLQRVRQLQQFLQTSQAVRLKDLAYTLNQPQETGQHCLTIVSATVTDLQEKLALAVKKLSDVQCHQIKDITGIYFFDQPLAKSGKLAFLFPGEGSQYINMLADLCIHFPELREHFDLIDRLFAQQARNYKPSDTIFPPPIFSAAERNQAKEKIWQMEGAVEAVLIANHAIFTLLNRLEIYPDCVVGHSTGEYSALWAAGMLVLKDEARIGQFSAELNQIYQQALAAGDLAHATLLAVAAPAEQVAAMIRAMADKHSNAVYIAMDNCPHQTVIVCAEQATAAVMEELHQRKFIYERLPFDRPYHTPLFQSYAQRLQQFLDYWISAQPQINTYSCTLAAPFTADLAHTQHIALEHWVLPVKFRKTVEAMYADGVRLFVEVGAGSNLTSFVNDILRHQPHVALPANVKGRSGITQLHHLIGLLAAQGLSLRLDYLYQHRAPCKIDLECPDDPYKRDPKSSTRLKLATGWPAMHISRELAAHLRTPNQPTMNTDTSLHGSEHTVPLMAAPTQNEVSQDKGANGTHAELGKAKTIENMTRPSIALAANARGQDSHSHPPTLQIDEHMGTRVQTQPAGAAQVMSAYLHTMDQFLGVQQEVMQAFLTGHANTQAPLSPASSKATWQEPAPGMNTNTGVTQENIPPLKTAVNQDAEDAPLASVLHTASPAALSESPAVERTLISDEPAIRNLLLRLVSERTGYPIDLLDLNLDLEANLGIDSIKRVEILGILQQQTGLIQSQDMEALSARKTLRAVIEFLVKPVEQSAASLDAQPGEIKFAAGAPHLQAASLPPLIDEVISLTPGEELVAKYELRSDKALFLKDHTLGQHIAVTDPDLRGLPIMPLTFSLEMLAEGASLLMPGKQLVAMRAIQAHRWILLESDTVALRLVAKRKPGLAEGEVYVCIYTNEQSADALSASASPLIEGTMIFEETIPASPLADEFSLHMPRLSPWSPEQLYQEVMFHGPAFQRICSLDRLGENGAEATLAVRDAYPLFRAGNNASLLTDPILLDQPGQVVGLWTAAMLEHSYVIFPFHVEAIQLYNFSPSASTHVQCRVQIKLLDERQVRSDLAIIGADNRVWLRLIGWEDRRFDLPEMFYRFLHAPQDVILSETLPAPDILPNAANLQLCRLNMAAFPEAFFSVHQGIWQKVLAHLILSRREREVWRSLGLPAPRRLAWLLGRLAAKDAVRHYLKQIHHLVLCPADIELLPDDNDGVFVGGVWTEQVKQAPHLSIVYRDGVAVAVASHGEIEINIEEVFLYSRKR